MVCDSLKIQNCRLTCSFPDNLNYAYLNMVWDMRHDNYDIIVSVSHLLEVVICNCQSLSVESFVTRGETFAKADIAAVNDNWAKMSPWLVDIHGLNLIFKFGVVPILPVLNDFGDYVVVLQRFEQFFGAQIQLLWVLWRPK